MNPEGPARRLGATLVCSLLMAYGCDGQLAAMVDAASDTTAPDSDGAAADASTPTPAEDAGGREGGSPDGSVMDATTADGGSPSGSHRVVGYFSSWSVYGRDFHVADLPGADLTHINYAFANLAGGACVLGDPYADTDKAYEGDSWEPGARRGSFHQLELLKARHPHLRTLLSVGGWTWSGAFSDMAATEVGRHRFAASCVELMVNHGFDGLDVDWEYPVGGGLPRTARGPRTERTTPRCSGPCGTR